ncbi:MAG: hypothetical protein IPO07_07220 [Haliscomenobacter sp.]|nr:hypothetical protein [Haliscomenobacter sp.]MBK9488590.1 hypothetical protein [Haliscomenobacter sp.]
MRYIRALNKLSIELETQYAITHTEFLAQVSLQQEPGERPLFPIEVNPTQVKRQLWQQALHLNGSITKRDQYTLRLQYGDQKINRVQEDTVRIPHFRINASIEHLFSDGGKTALSFQSSLRPIHAQAVFSSFYLADPYTLVRLVPRTTAERGQSLSLTYNRKDTDRFRFYFIMFKLGLNQDNWQDSLFFCSLQVTQPYFTQDNNSFVSMGRFEQFIPKLKLNLKFGTGFSASKQLIGAYGENLPLQVRTLNLNADFIRSFGHHFKIDVFNKLESMRSFTSEIGARIINFSIGNCGLRPFGKKMAAAFTLTKIFIRITIKML